MDGASVSAFYRKWRSQSFADLVGQDAIARTLRNAVRTGRVAHAYLFCGPRGVGKTSAARILAKAINCPNVSDGEPCARCESCRSIQDGQALDVIEIDAASNNGVEQIRDLREKVGLAPAVSHYKIYILDEAHMLSGSAWNALLKTLEEPPPHAVFVLVTTDAQKLPETIVSRCQRLDFRRIGIPDAVGRLGYVCQQEGVVPETGVLELLARSSAGSLRDAEGALDQVVAYAGTRPTLAQARAVLGIAGPDAARELVALVLAGNAEAAIRFVNRLIDEGADPRQIALDVLETLRNLLLLRTSDALADLVDESEEARLALRQVALAASPQQLVELIRIFTPAPPTRVGLRPQLPLEIAVVEAVNLRENGAAAQILSAPSRPTPNASPVSTAFPPPSSPAPIARPTSPLVSPPPPVTRNGSPSGPVTPPAASVSEPSPPAAAATARPVQSGGAILLDAARMKWNDVLEACGTRNRSVQALLRSARPVEIDGEYLVLGFAYEFHRERIEEQKNRGIVEEIIERIVGQKARIRCILLSREAVVAADPVQAVVDDPLVKAAVGMGARVRSVTDDRPEEKT